MLTLVPMHLAWSRCYYWSIRDGDDEVATVGLITGDRRSEDVDGLDEAIERAMGFDPYDAWTRRAGLVLRVLG